MAQPKPKLAGYYFNSDTGQSIPAERPRSLTFAQAQHIFQRLHDGSFLGLEVADETVLQLLNEEGVWHTELLNTSSLSGKACRMTHPMAVQVLESAFSGEDIRVSLAARYPWLTWDPFVVPPAAHNEEHER